MEEYLVYFMNNDGEDDYVLIKAVSEEEAIIQFKADYTEELLDIIPLDETNIPPAPPYDISDYIF